MDELALFAGAGGGILGGHLLGWRTAQPRIQRMVDGLAIASLVAQPREYELARAQETTANRNLPPRMARRIRKGKNGQIWTAYYYDSRDSAGERKETLPNSKVLVRQHFQAGNKKPRRR
ncbi:hypothetical protein AO265_02145 [Pseudomonas sp. ABAC61]|nr:hypothetical protein AO265_02145 [Pseudomonas sp. ABAC61]